MRIYIYTKKGLKTDAGNQNSCIRSPLLLPFPVRLLKTETIRDKIKLNKRAHQKLTTLKSGTIQAASIITRAFITNRNRPSVKIVMGIVKIIKIGLTTAFKILNTAATIMASKKEFTCTPGNI